MKKRMLALLCAAALAASWSLTAFAQEDTAAEEQQKVSKTNKFYGTIKKTEEAEGKRFLLNANTPGTGETQDMLLNVSDETLILDAVSGMPVSLSDIQDGSMAYTYVSPMMTLSYPPQVSAYVVLTKIPADYRVPSLEEVKNLTMNEDGSAVVETVSGTTYHVPADCSVIPYLTRNMVYIDSLTEGTNFLIWSELSEDGQTEKASRIMIFARGQLPFDQPSGPAEEADFNNLMVPIN